MDQRLPCPHCRALNRPDAPYCGLCLTRNPSSRGSGGVVAAVAQTVPVVDAVETPRAAPIPIIRPAARTKEVRWRWHHLILFGAVAWGVPALLMRLLPPDGTLTNALDKTLALQMVGYFLGILVATVFVKVAQGGDWGSLGLRREEIRADEILSGAAFGFGLVAGAMGVGYFLNQGHLRFDWFIGALIGETSSGGLALAALVVVLGAPIIEEIYYRGMLFEKFSRRGPMVAVIVTSILFMLAHGGIIILIGGMGLLLGYKRLTKPLAYTMAAHATWNFVVILLAGLVLLGPPKVFTADDGAYSFKHPANWQRVPEAEFAMQEMKLDFAAQVSSGAEIAVLRAPTPPGFSEKHLVDSLNQVAAFVPGTTGKVKVTKSKFQIDGTAAYELAATLVEGDIKGKMRMVFSYEPNRQMILTFLSVCPQGACKSVKPEFETMLSSIDLK